MIASGRISGSGTLQVVSTSMDHSQKCNECSDLTTLIVVFAADAYYCLVFHLFLVYESVLLQFFLVPQAELGTGPNGIMCEQQQHCRKIKIETKGK